MGDRGGGREAKKGSLKTSKKNPGAPAGRTKLEAQESGPAVSAKAPAPGAGAHVDCGAALLSRLFERDRGRVVQRAREGSVSAVVCWSSDVTKQQAVADVCRENAGLVYFLVGVHPDNVRKGGADKAGVRLAEDLAQKAECVGVLSGLHLQREQSTHYAQKQGLKDAARLSEMLALPLVLHLGGDDASFDEAVEVVREAGLPNGNSAVIIHDALSGLRADVDLVRRALDEGWLMSVSAAGITTAEGAAAGSTSAESGGGAAALAAARACVAAIPLHQILVCSDAPWHTPQNLEDDYMRAQRNEPSTLPFVVRAVADARGLASAELKTLEAALKRNALVAFGLADEKVASRTKNADEKVTDGDVVVSVGDAAAAASDPAHPLAVCDRGLEADGVQTSGGETHEEGPCNLADAPSNLDTLASLTVGAGAPHYACHKCRAFLFEKTAVLGHAADAARTIFEGGGESLCDAVLFLRHAGAGADGAIVVKGATAECGECSAKLGRFVAGAAPCTCGADVAGPAVRIISSKVDFVSGPTALLALVERARAEAAALDEDYDGRGKKGPKKKKQPKQQVTRPDGIGLGRNTQRGSR
ncbi:TatD related DNase-domain-containing protein [Pelagophyceae sp. CCMP2097]|nr:TatD related DNase-domain-containing protein [Pelagophyceae sp. CCMP2097]|mmetsp:Transcript_30041/g.101282  ORF Transcript_30041/g.101282 Transcript_30041/m.101282 type:complete len:588 (-) Transcript_30041:9-1772(-)